MNIGDLGFAWPQAFLLLLLVPVYVWARHRLQKRAAVPMPTLQYRSGSSQRGFWARWRLPLEAFLLVLVILGVAGPQFTREVELLGSEGIDVALVLDVSLSMKADDFPPNRLAALKVIARDFVEQSGPNRFALLIFAGDVFVQAPMTTDRQSVLNLIDGMSFEMISHSLEESVGSAGTAIGDALLAAAERLAAAKVEGRDQALILLTDGDNTTGVDPTLAARFVAEQDVSVSIIGIGKDEPVEVIIEGNDEPYIATLDTEALAAISDAAGGTFYRATDAGALVEVFAELARLESAPLDARQVEIRRPWSSAVALAALPIYGLYLFLAGYVVRRPFR